MTSDITVNILSSSMKCCDVSPCSHASPYVVFTNLYSSVISIIVDENTDTVARPPSNGAHYTAAPKRHRKPLPSQSPSLRNFVNRKNKAWR
jgi:hypothetical protein